MSRRDGAHCPACGAPAIDFRGTYALCACGLEWTSAELRAAHAIVCEAVELATADWLALDQVLDTEEPTRPRLTLPMAPAVGQDPRRRHQSPSAGQRGGPAWHQTAGATGCVGPREAAPRMRSGAVTRSGTPLPRTLGDLRTRLQPSPSLAAVAARLDLSERSLEALEACPLDSASVATLRFYPAGIGAQLELRWPSERTDAI